MVKVEFLGPIGYPSIEVEAANLADLAQKLKEIEDIKEWLSNSAVAVNDVIVDSLDTPLKDGDRVSILPPVCGG